MPQINLGPCECCNTAQCCGVVDIFDNPPAPNPLACVFIQGVECVGGGCGECQATCLLLNGLHILERASGQCTWFKQYNFGEDRFPMQIGLEFNDFPHGAFVTIFQFPGVPFCFPGFQIDSQTSATLCTQGPVPWGFIDQNDSCRLDNSTVSWFFTGCPPPPGGPQALNVTSSLDTSVTGQAPSLVIPPPPDQIANVPVATFSAVYSSPEFSSGIPPSQDTTVDEESLSVDYQDPVFSPGTPPPPPNICCDTSVLGSPRPQACVTISGVGSLSGSCTGCDQIWCALNGTHELNPGNESFCEWLKTYPAGHILEGITIALIHNYTVNENFILIKGDLLKDGGSLAYCIPAPQGGNIVADTFRTPPTCRTTGYLFNTFESSPLCDVFSGASAQISFGTCASPPDCPDEPVIQSCQDYQNIEAAFCTAVTSWQWSLDISNQPQACQDALINSGILLSGILNIHDCGIVVPGFTRWGDANRPWPNTIAAFGDPNPCIFYPGFPRCVWYGPQISIRCNNPQYPQGVSIQFWAWQLDLVSVDILGTKNIPYPVTIDDIASVHVIPIVFWSSSISFPSCSTTFSSNVTITPL